MTGCASEKNNKKFSSGCICAVEGLVAENRKGGWRARGAGHFFQTRQERPQSGQDENPHH